MGAEAPVVGLFEGPFTTLCRVLPTEGVMRMIYKRRAVAEALLERPALTLAATGRYDLERDDIFIPAATVADWYNAATNDHKKVAAVSRTMRQAPRGLE